MRDRSHFPCKTGQWIGSFDKEKSVCGTTKSGLWLFGAVCCLFVAGCLPRYGQLEREVSQRIHDKTADIQPLVPQEDESASSISNLDDDNVDDDQSVREALRIQAENLTTPDEAPSQIDLEVAELRLKTLEQNLDLDVVFREPAMARTRVSEEEAKFDALITAGFSYKREDLPPLDGDLVQFTSFNKDLDKEVVKITEIEQEKEKFEYDLGLIVPLPTGGKLKFSGSLDEKNKLSPRSFEQHVSAMKFSLSQPLLRGAGVEANVAPIRIARLAAGKVAVKTKLAAIRVLAGAEKAYWKVYGARRMRDVQQQQFDLAAQNLEMVRRRVEEGLSAGIEVIRSELGVTQRLEDLILADTELRIQQRKLRMIMNDPSLPLESETFIVPTTEPRLIPFELSNDELAAAALENRMEMLELELSLAQDALKIDLARNKALPNFVLDFEYGILDRRSSFSRAWQEMWDFDNSQLSIGLRGEIPVTNIARRSQVQRAVLKRLQRLSSQELRALKIKQEVYNAVDALNRDWLRILAARQNVIVAGVNYDAEMNQFREGLRTMREVVEALTSLGKAQLKEIKAIVSYQIDQIDLAYATGTVLGYAQIDIEPLVLPEPYQPEHDLLVQPDWDE